jgi:hypothetical protein
MTFTARLAEAAHLPRGRAARLAAFGGCDSLASAEPGDVYMVGNQPDQVAGLPQDRPLSRIHSKSRAAAPAKRLPAGRVRGESEGE